MQWFWAAIAIIAVICLIGIVAELSGFFTAWKKNKLSVTKETDGRYDYYYLGWKDD